MATIRPCRAASWFAWRSSSSRPPWRPSGVRRSRTFNTSATQNTAGLPAFFAATAGSTIRSLSSRLAHSVSTSTRPGPTPLSPGERVEFAGTLLLDHYIWVEYLHTYPDPPDLFYNLRVTRIRKVTVPERFIARHEGGKALPSRVGPADFEKVEDLATMEGQPFDEEFFVIDFDGAGLEGANLPLTFQ